MTDKRKDNRGRILHNGETQRKDGRYCYQYTDTLGKRHAVYSWRLEQRDRVVPGKKSDLSLREKEKQIQADIFDKIIPQGNNLKVVELVKYYTEIKESNVGESTKASYRTVIKLLEKDAFGRKRIDQVSVSCAMKWLENLKTYGGKGYSTIRTIRGVLRPAFQLAVNDDLIRKNPFSFELKDVIYDDSKMRQALSPGDERKFLKFVKEDEHFSRYYEGVFILFNTGLRISEFCGLTLSDIDFDNMMINVDHQLQRYPKIGDCIIQPKTKAGKRKVPMDKEVAECFRIIIKNRKKIKVEPIIDGYSGFLYLDKKGRPLVAWHWEKYFQHICEKYNRIYRVPLPNVTPHVARHTFCSRKASKRMDPKALQIIMGHSDVATTFNVYTHLDDEEVAREYNRVSGNI